MSFESTAMSISSYPNSEEGDRASSSSNHVKMLTLPEISAALVRAALLVPPNWTLRDTVAVNPFLGYADTSILDAHQAIRSRLAAQVLPQIKDMAHFYSTGAFTLTDIQEALSEKPICSSAQKFLLSVSLAEIMLALDPSNFLSRTLGAAESSSSLAGWLDYHLTNPGKWKSDILVDISRFCSSRFDEGVARWSCFKNGGLFSSWTEYAMASRGMYARGLKGFHEYVKKLPLDVPSAVLGMLKELGISSAAAADEYISSLLGELPGWAGFLRQQAWQISQVAHGELPDLVAIRMAYDVALYKDNKFRALLEDKVANLGRTLPKQIENDKDLATRYTLLRAAEIAYFKSIQNKLSGQQYGSVNQEPNERAALQAVFCIDVRSEVLRRHLGLTAANIETYGFAGFFGLPLKMEDNYGDEQPQCPVLLKPLASVKHTSFQNRLNLLQSVKKLFKNFSTSANSGFTYVETVGFLSFFSMLRQMLPLNSPSTGFHSAQAITVESYSLVGIDSNTKLAFAKAILKNLGLRAPYARLVLLCGHGSKTENNPQAAGLACGACAGHSGAPNACIAAELLNDKTIRARLALEGWEIPLDTIFVPALHDTVADEIEILGSVPGSHLQELATVQQQLQHALTMVRSERSPKLGIGSQHKKAKTLFSSLQTRQKDISEVRPEWALAGNACFIAAKSEALKGLNFEGRSFLHNYDSSLDSDGSVLETILTAPVVVASWINLQYFASSVDPQHFGSGSKTIHNIAAGIGVICGNDGDLAAGLSLQSVHDGKHLQHQPLRLQVFIQASIDDIDKVIQKHPFLKNLFRNEWMLLYATNPTLQECYRWMDTQEWRLQNYGSPSL